MWATTYMAKTYGCPGEGLPWLTGNVQCRQLHPGVSGNTGCYFLKDGLSFRILHTGFHTVKTLCINIAKTQRKSTKKAIYLCSTQSWPRLSGHLYNATFTPPNDKRGTQITTEQFRKHGSNDAQNTESKTNEHQQQKSQTLTTIMGMKHTRKSKWRKAASPCSTGCRMDA